jgi:ketosteroid isomerase-like protein
MRGRKVEQELLRLEERYWRAVQAGDLHTVVKLSDDPCIVAGAQGVVWIDHAALAVLLISATYTLDAFEIVDAQVRLIGDDVAIVAYKVHEELTVDGEKVRLDAADASTWVKKGGRWVCALHTQSLPGDPFGRSGAA